MSPHKSRECSGDRSDLTNPTPNSHDDCFEQDKFEAIAIVGLSLKFPQKATSSDSFWNMLMEGRCAVTEVPEDRWNLASFYHPDRERKDSVCLISRIFDSTAPAAICWC